MNQQTQRRRSPNYPRATLPKILLRLKKYRAQITDEIGDEENIARRIGYSGVTGASVPVISALKKFGLLESLPNGFGFSSRAIEIITLDENDPAFANLVEQTAFTDELYAEIRAHFGKQYPNVSKLREFLLIKGFVPNGVATVIDLYRQTFDFVASLRDDYQSGPDRNIPVDDNTRDNNSEQNKEKITAEKTKTELKDQQLNFELGGGIELSIKFTGNPSTSSIGRLADCLKIIEQFIESGDGGSS